MKWDQGYRILFVDDDEVYGKVFLKWFSLNTNYELDYAVNAAGGFRSIEAKDFDLIIVNVRMPGMDGLEFTRIVKERHDTKIIIYTAGDLPGERSKAFAYGAHARLFKPTPFEHLADFIVQLMTNSMKFIGNHP